MVANSRTLESGSVTSMRSSRGICAAVVKVFLAVLLGSVVQAQNLNNTGTIANTGTIRIKGQVNGMPAAMDGVFEYFGANQTVPASTYANLVLSGVGTKTTSGGNISVLRDLTIANTVTLVVEPLAVLTLGGALNEHGYLTGSIQKTVDLSGGTTSSNFGNIGGTISWMNTAPGITTVRRSSGAAVVGRDSNESIKRFCEINAANNGLNATLILRYENRELNGHDSTKLILWRSLDNGLTWIDEGGSVDVVARTLTKTGVATLRGIWAIADSAHPLGQIGRVATNLHYVAGAGLIDTIGARLDAMIVRVTDIQGFPVYDHSITFTITGTPPGATGQMLTATSARSDSNGIAFTHLVLGNKVGTYTVEAAAHGLTGSSISFRATATHGLPTTFAKASGDTQSGVILTPLSEPFVVRIADRGDNPVAGVAVTFAITSTPVGATGQRLSANTGVSDRSGMVSTTLTLGNKVGTYTVTATSGTLTGSPVTFSATATTGAAAMIALTSGNNQSGVINTALANPFVVTVTDAGGNPVEGTSVTFAIAATPAGATGQVISGTQPAITDANGNASTILTLGNKVGTYTVTATSGTLTGNPVTFTATATAGAAAKVVILRGDNQSGKIMQNLKAPFVVKVTDLGDNPVSGVSVTFEIMTTPANAVGTALNPTSGVTDAMGEASTVMKLGNLTGTYTARATVAGVGFVTFTARATRVQALDIVPTEYQLFQNYPNPFNLSTKIRFALPEESRVRIEIYNLLGSLVTELVNEQVNAGVYEATWKPDNMPSGVYIVRMESEAVNSKKAFSASKRMMLLK